MGIVNCFFNVIHGRLIPLSSLPRSDSSIGPTPSRSQWRIRRNPESPCCSTYPSRLTVQVNVDLEPPSSRSILANHKTKITHTIIIEQVLQTQVERSQRSCKKEEEGKCGTGRGGFKTRGVAERLILIKTDMDEA